MKKHLLGHDHPWLYFVIVVLLCAIGVISIAHARDLTGKYANSPDQAWFNSLTNQNGVPCCDTADGRRLDDADWATEGEKYRVRIDGKWFDVPDTALIRGQNRKPYAIVWPYESDGITYIRCFAPGTMS